MKSVKVPFFNMSVNAPVSCYGQVLVDYDGINIKDFTFDHSDTTKLSRLKQAALALHMFVMYGLWKLTYAEKFTENPNG